MFLQSLSELCVSSHVQHHVRTERTDVVHWCVCSREANVKVAESAVKTERFWHLVACLLWFQNKRKGSFPTVLLFLPDTDSNAAVRNAEHKNEYKHHDAASVDPAWMKPDTRSSYLKPYQGICLRLHYNHRSVFRRLMYNLKLQIQMEFVCFGLFISFLLFLLLSETFQLFFCVKLNRWADDTAQGWGGGQRCRNKSVERQRKNKAAQLQETVAEEERCKINKK